MKVEVYPDSQLGTIPEMLSAMQVGSLQMTMAVPAWYSKFMKPLDAFTLPYIVPSPDRLKTALDGALGQRNRRDGRIAGFQIIGYWLIGGRHIVNKLRPVNKPADCAGLKIRVINSQVYIQTFRALGATTVAMDPSELYLALQQGVVDGFEYPLPDLSSYKFYEVSKYLSLDSHTTDFFLISINKALWEGFRRGRSGHDGTGDEDGDGLAVDGAAGRDRQVAGQAEDADAGERHHARQQGAVRRSDAVLSTSNSSLRSARNSSTSPGSSWGPPE